MPYLVQFVLPVEDNPQRRFGEDTLVIRALSIDLP